MYKTNETVVVICVRGYITLYTFNIIISVTFNERFKIKMDTRHCKLQSTEVCM
jgi:hypothetical protein